MNKKSHADLLGLNTERLKGKTIKEVRITKELCGECIVFEDGCLLTLTEQDPYDYHDCSPFARDFKFWTKEDAEAMVTKGWAGGCWVDKWWEKVYEVIL